MKPFGRAATASELHNSFALDQTLLQVLVGICSLIQSVPAGDGLQGHNPALQHIQQDGGVDSGLGSERALNLDLAADHAGDVDLAKSAQLGQSDHDSLASVTGGSNGLVKSNGVSDHLEGHVDSPATRRLGHHLCDNILGLAAVDDRGSSHRILSESQLFAVQVDCDDVRGSEGSADLHHVHADTTSAKNCHGHARLHEASVFDGAVSSKERTADDGGVGSHRFHFLRHLVGAKSRYHRVLGHATLRVLVERGAIGQLHSGLAVVEPALQAVVVEEALADVLVPGHAGRAIAARHDERRHNGVSDLQFARQAIHRDAFSQLDDLTASLVAHDAGCWEGDVPLDNMQVGVAHTSCPVLHQHLTTARLRDINGRRLHPAVRGGQHRRLHRGKASP
mmetsp:Transcript_3497/g.7855  ORF Transcript_3497/g.7855 Transcript_3497/m.7855 type:complete len:393 (-) Transcript_3497:120-1298(-)